MFWAVPSTPSPAGQQGLGTLKQLHLLIQETLWLLVVDLEPSGLSFCTEYLSLPRQGLVCQWSNVNETSGMLFLLAVLVEGLMKIATSRGRLVAGIWLTETGGWGPAWAPPVLHVDQPNPRGPFSRHLQVQAQCYHWDSTEDPGQFLAQPSPSYARRCDGC